MKVTVSTTESLFYNYGNKAEKELHRYVQISSLHSIVLLNCFKIVLAEVVEKVKELR